MSNPRTGRPMRRARERLMQTNRICGYCGKPIDTSLPASDPMSYTVDHTTPLSHGGALLDPANHVPMHRSCNSSKGNGERKRLPTSRKW